MIYLSNRKKYAENLIITATVHRLHVANVSVMHKVIITDIVTHNDYR